MRRRLPATTTAVLALLVSGAALSPDAVAAPPPPDSVTAIDRPGDGGGVAEVSWTPAPGDALIVGWQVWRTETDSETGSRDAAERASALAAAESQAYDEAYARLVQVEGIAPEDAAVQARAEARDAVRAIARDPDALETTELGPHGRHWVLVDTVDPEVTSIEVGKLDAADRYSFMVYALEDGPNGGVERSTPSTISAEVAPVAAPVDLRRLPLLVILAVLCGAVLFFILQARSGRTLKIRKIAGLAAVDEAVGRATEMGRPILFVPGIQDMDDLQTVAGITVLGRVAKTAAEYDARIEVPTSRSLVMSAAREAVHASYLSAGRSDSYNPDLIYYVTDEQFGYTAYASGLIVREKPAACFYMGCFFAESLILAETGNSVGAIQIAGTAMPSQLPFFVAACDYTLIGEEFFAASAYLSGQPDQLGSLKGQDIGKILVGITLIIGCLAATVAALTGSSGLEEAVMWFKNSVLSA